MKVSELSGALLDYWVARANGWTRKAGAWVDSQGVEQYAPAVCYDPSHAWELAGPIIERESIDLVAWDAQMDMAWCGARKVGDRTIKTFGPTPRIAAMRSFVASKFGDTVPDEQ
jgi:hypothetical protein